jgi:DHA1 family bicyclomycin/chloramphenicol resistance-like MFS transporter
MASALAGTLQFVVATTASGLVSYFHNGTLVPMTAIMGLGSFLAIAIYFRFPSRA